ncbi:MAG TPA: RbsD/FucU family protein [Aggregatilineaceae bacterium]|nr:RbsD/FucU family protein [Aggregatilineaceae bacterium]
MIRGELLHPQILKALAGAGHGSRVLIADGNYPFTTGSHPNAEHVFLNLAPGKMTVTDVLSVLVKVIPIEAAHAIAPDSGPEPRIFAEYRQLMPEVELQTLGRFPFYEAARSPDTALVIATGEQRTWACILLTIGVIPPA